MKKIIALTVILALCLPFVLACGQKEEKAPATEAPTENTAPVEETKATEPPPPTEPPTEKPTDPPTEPPTDPAELPEAIKIGDYEIIPGARYYLWSPNCDLYMTCDGDFKYAGLTQEDFTGKPDQMFVFDFLRQEDTPTTTRYIFKIRPLGTRDKYVDVEGGIDEMSDGSGIVCTVAEESAGSQEWSIKAQKKTKLTEDDGTLVDDFAAVDLPLFSVMSVISKNQKCLDVNGVSKNSGGNIHLWGGGTANNQKWFFELVSDVESGKITPRGKK